MPRYTEKLDLSTLPKDKAEATAILEKRAAQQIARAKIESARVNKTQMANYPEKKAKADALKPKLSPQEKRAKTVAKKAHKAQKSREYRQRYERIRSEQAVQRELARRELSRRSLLAYIMRQDKNYLAGWVHKDICMRFEKFSDDVAAGKSPRLMLFMPPRYGKSMIASQSFPAWHMGKYPQHDFISCSYSSPLAMNFSRKIQDQLRSQDYHNLFSDTRISKRNESVESWATTQGGEFLAAGVGGPITGRGANILLIDDPIKNREEAESATQRQHIKDWYTSTAYTRLMPGGGVCIIQTRWHDDDLSGWLLTEQAEAKVEADEAIAEGREPEPYDQWEVITYPAIAIDDELYRKRGEVLHPERYPRQSVLKTRRTVGKRDWSALYQQTPTAEEGDFFNKGMLKYYSSTPRKKYLDYYTAGDLAISKQEHADFTVFVTVAVDANEDLYVVDMRRGKWDTAEIVEQMLSIQRMYQPKRFGIEKGHISMALGPFLDKRIQETREYGLVVEELKPGKRDKQLRARPLQGRMSQGKVLLPTNALWLDVMVNELLRFPNGLKDDVVDAMAWIGQMLVNIVPPAPRKRGDKLRLIDKINNYARRKVGANSAMAA